MHDTNAERTVQGYLAAMEARDLDKAKSMLAPGFTMVFPGGHEFRAPEELVAWSTSRYRSVAKTYDAFESLPTGSESDDQAIVYCRGTLCGQWPDGTAFSGIRFIDRFTVSGGKITTQMVWNDLAEVVRAQRAET